eukprot:TRINITY_DN91238_c0_g1_i1.p1 TRINITY_DN91238_c0_g1~~TRINITY_DN91238_c0_g1_i1.p1  ORF type:complete len:648 (-),score=88.24 TRINITY_DN91238_c0_g1_i1:23-1966(-)
MARSSCWSRLIAAGLWIASCVAGVGDLCFRGEFTAERCCVQKDPECWDAVFTEARCCPDGAQDGVSSGRGNPICWVDGYTYKECCREDPKAGCWDSEFSPEFCCADPPDDQGKAQAVEIWQQDMGDLYIRKSTFAAEGPLGCEDTPPGLWRQVKVAATSMNVSRQYGMPGEKPDVEVLAVFAKQALRWLSDDAAWASARVACPAGVINLIDLIAAHVDREIGEDEARGLVKLRQSLLQGSSTPLAYEADGWPTLSGNDHVARLLNVEPHSHCHKSSLKVFMYRLPKLAHMTKPVLTCSQKMSQCTAGVHIHRWFENSACLTDDPAQADLFYVPAYEACYNETACGFDDNTERCFKPDFDVAKDLEHFSKKRGMDHIFVFSCNLLPFHDTIMTSARQSVMVTVESYQAQNFAGPNMFAWFSQWKDVLIPGYIPQWRIDAMLAFNRPVLKRSILVSFHGHYRRSPEVGYMYKRSPLAEVRERVVDYFWNKSDASVGPPVRDYFRRMGTSRFCLIPAGLTAWTIHLYESFFFGCVPVILSDELTVPFQEEIDWTKLSLQVPTSIDMEELHERLKAFSIGRLKDMHRRLVEARCWFDYSNGWVEQDDGKPPCSPYLGLLRGLESRTPRLARNRNEPLYSLPATWSPPPRKD